MSPVYGDEHGLNQNQQNYSNRCPIEREVLVSSADRNSKIPILNEYIQRNSAKVAIAPDAPVKQQAWVQNVEQPQDQSSEKDSKSFTKQEVNSFHVSDSVSQNLKSEDERTKSLSRTYHTIKDMISSRFGPSKKDIHLNPKELNNVPEDRRKSGQTIEREEQNGNQKNTGYGHSLIQDTSSCNMEQYLTQQQYGGQQNQSYHQSPQQNLLLPGQLQTIPQTQQSFSGQSAQLHVSHISPPGGVQTVHQTQIATCRQKLQLRNDYRIPGPNSIPHVTHHDLSQLQQQPVGTHGVPLQNIAGTNVLLQSPQLLIHHNQLHQSSRFSQQHVQSINQRHILQQMNHHHHHHQQQQQQQQQQHQRQAIISASLSHQHARQIISKSQMDLPSTLNQSSEHKIEDIYYHYNQGRPKYSGRPQIYIKQDNNQDSENQKRNSVGRTERASSQLQLCYNSIQNAEHEIIDNNETKKYLKNNSVLIKHENTIDDQEQEIASDVHVTEKIDKSSERKKEDVKNLNIQQQLNTENGKQDEKFSMQKKNEESMKNDIKKNIVEGNHTKLGQAIRQVNKAADRIGETTKKNETNYQERLDSAKNDIEQGISKLKFQNKGSGSDYDKAGQSSSNVDSGRGSAIYSSGRKPLLDGLNNQGHDSEWVDIVESELRSILEPRDVLAMAHSTLSESVSSVTPPLPPLSSDSPLTQRNRYSISSPYGVKPNYADYSKHIEKQNFEGSTKQRATSTLKKDSSKKFSHLFGFEVADLTSTTTGLDLDSVLDRSDSDLSTNDTRTIRKQLEGLENMYGEVLKLLSGSVKKRRKARGLASYGSVSSLPTSSVSSRPVPRHNDKKRYHAVDDRTKKAKDLKSINKRFQRLESHVVTLARSVAHLSSEMRTQHLMIQEMENIRSEMTALRTQTNMAMVRSQSQPILKDSDLPALSNPSRVKKLTKFFGTEPPLIRLFLRELGYEKYATAFENEKVGMVELPYLSEERLQKIGVPLGPRLRILQEARISVCKDPVYVI